MGTRRAAKQATGGYSLFEVGRSEFGQALPKKFPGGMHWPHTLVALAPLALSGTAMYYQTRTIPAGFGLDLHLCYTAMAGLLCFSLLWAYRSHVKQVHRALVLHLYVSEHFQPALHYAGMLATPAESESLLLGRTVVTDPERNLYGADLVRVIHLSPDEDALQFELSG